MTIKRELQSVTIKAYAHESASPYDLVVDDYGQLTYASTTRSAKMAVKVYSQQNVQDPRYVDVEMVGLTQDKSIVPGEVVSLAQGDYRVKYVIPTGRWQEILLSKL